VIKLKIPKAKMMKKAEELKDQKTEAKIWELEKIHTGRIIWITKEGTIIIMR